METDLDVDEANDLADDILRGADFVGAEEPGIFERATSRVWEFIVDDVLGRIFRTLFGNAGGGAGSAMAFVLLGIVVLILIAAIVRAFRTGRVRSSAAATPGVRIIFDQVVDPAELRRELAARRASGDWRGAVVAGFRLAVIEMIDAGLVAERAGATTGDFGRAIAATRPDMSAVYADAAGAFERAFYSDAVIEPSDADAVTLLLGRLQRVDA